MTAPEPTMRILKYIFIVSILLFIFVTIQVPSRATRPPQQPIELILILLALLNLAMGLNARRLFARLGLANAKRGAQSTPLKGPQGEPESTSFRCGITSRWDALSPSRGALCTSGRARCGVTFLKRG